MDVRHAGEADAQIVLELERAVFGADAWSREAVLDELTGHTRAAFLAGEPPVGWASIVVAGDVADLTRIGVRPDARRGGRARALLDRAREEARSRGAARMLLEVAQHNDAALALYAGCGFTRVAVRRAYYADGSDALVMEDVL